ncbi:MAG TPA: sugar ABC transporter substrate-binding protein [Actinomycetaceae bacterium]|nr:sugar ABC transporter substrate-binding protein [Actinomycetaceae bacterium]
MRKRAMVGATAVLALTLAACGNGTDADDTDTGNGAAADGEEVELTVWHYFSEDFQVELMDSYAEKFEAEHDNVTVSNVFQPYDQMNSMVVSAAGAGEGPDVVVFNGAEWSTLAMAGALAPLDDYLAEFEDADQISDAVQHGMDGSTYAVQGYVNLLGLWYNADLLEEIGVEPPTTMDELESAMAAAVDAGYRGITLSALPQSQGEWQAYPWLSSEGFTYENLDEEALAAGFARVRGWIEEGYLSQEAVTWDQTVPFQQFTAGEVAFAENGNWQIGAAEADADFEYGVVPLPLSETGQVYLGGEGQAIGANSEHPDLAWEYLTSTYLDFDGQLEAQESVGSIPSRADASQEEASNELLEPFAQTLNDMGTNYPASVIPPEAVADVQNGVGQAWSSALAGQMTPEEAAAQVIGQLQNLLG